MDRLVSASLGLRKSEYLWGIFCDVRCGSNWWALGDDSERWVGGFVMNIGTCSVMNAELWGIFQGLPLALDQGYRKVIMESDSMAAVSAIINNDRTPNGNCALICNLKKLLQRE